MNVLGLILKIIKKIEDNISAIALWAVNTLIFFEVLNRYFLHLELMWINDLALYIFLLFAFFACTVTTREDAHTAVDVVRQKYFMKTPKMESIYSSVLNIISIVSVLFFLPSTWKFMLRSMKYPQYGTLVRWFNTSWLQSTVFIVTILMLIHLFTTLIKNISTLKNFKINR